MIRGSAVNQDGRTNGLTAPSGRAQEAVLRAGARRRPASSPAQVGYVEAHGTGTPLGDPIEVEALAEVLGAAGAEATLPARLGQDQHRPPGGGGAGIAGLIKVVLCAAARGDPRAVHFRELNPHIASTSYAPGRSPDGCSPGRAESRRRCGGVNSFGFGGTNAHVVLEEARAAARPAAGGATRRGIVLAAFRAQGSRRCGAGRAYGAAAGGA